MAARGSLARLLVIATIGIAAGLPAAPAGAVASDIQVVPTPALARQAALTAVSFSSAADGWAVGRVGESLAAPSDVDTLIEHWNGSSWTVSPTPAVDASDETLTGVVALSGTDAWAVGRQDRYGYNDDLPLLLHWDGSGWSPAQAPSARIPTAIAGSAADDVWAVGTGVFQHFDGVSWSVVAVPDSKAVISSVTVVSATDAWAVGQKPVDKPGYDHTSHPYAAHWNGVAWRTVFVPHASTDARLASVSASSAGDVWAVGSAFDRRTGDHGTYAQHFDGTRWRQVDIPDQGASNGLTGVVAVSADAAYAVGHRDGQTSLGAVWRTVVQRWDGHSWTIMTSPNDTRSDNYLTSVSVVGSDMWAVGSDGGTLAVRAASG